MPSVWGNIKKEKTSFYFIFCYKNCRGGHACCLLGRWHLNCGPLTSPYLGVPRAGTLTLEWFVQIRGPRLGCRLQHRKGAVVFTSASYLPGGSSATRDHMAISVSTAVYCGHEVWQDDTNCPGCPISLIPC